MTHKQKIKRDLILIGLSLIFGIILLKTGLVKHALLQSEQLEILGIFIAGVLFTSIFTTIPAIIALGELSTRVPLPILVVVGGIGALFGDYIIFMLFRDNIAEDFKYMFSLSTRKRWAHIFRSRLFKAFLTLIGGVIIASPLPDELGLALMGITKTNTFTFAIISLVCNCAGILVIGLIARSLT